jgi:hypothetical protein
LHYPNSFIWLRIHIYIPVVSSSYVTSAIIFKYNKALPNRSLYPAVRRPLHRRRLRTKSAKPQVDKFNYKA